MENDALLIDEALAGNTEAFGKLVQHYQDRLFNSLVYAIGSREEAEDVAQEAFVLAFVKLSSFRRDSSFYTWLYRIAINASVSRRRKKRPEVSSDAMNFNIVANTSETPEPQPAADLERQEQAVQVHAALNRLSDEHRQVVVLREMDGHGYDVIAELLGIPVGTVRSRLHRARSQLRELLGGLLQQHS
ncbi:MAG: sigma-70 family RNA polymerase sigma factor [Pirellulaceae bacterium]|nr:sigma-70 family RNA polymerase sigma factor [Planctomycetales bacterium]